MLIFYKKRDSNDTFQVSPITLVESRLQELQSHLMLFFTGFTRFASDIAKDKIKNFKNCEGELKHMGEMVDESIKSLQSNTVPIDDFGAL